jgi:hypothetical protein
MVSGMRRALVRTQTQAMTTTDLHQAAGLRTTHLSELLRRTVVRSGPLLRPLAGRRLIPIWAVIRYRGRRSGKEYALPIAIAATPESFVIPMPFVGAQWVLNVIAAGECIIRWKGQEWRAVEPEVISKAEGAKRFGPVARFALRHLPIERFLRLRRA